METNDYINRYMDPDRIPKPPEPELVIEEVEEMVLEPEDDIEWMLQPDGAILHYCLINGNERSSWGVENYNINECCNCREPIPEKWLTLRKLAKMGKEKSNYGINANDFYIFPPARRSHGINARFYRGSR